MHFKLTSPLFEAFEELDRINEDSGEPKRKQSWEQIKASQYFWSRAKNDSIEEHDFHKAFDDELTELGLMHLFDEHGRLANESSIDEINKAKEANPDSWAVRALYKMWWLKFKRHAYSRVDAELKKKAEEEEKIANANAAYERSQKNKARAEACQALVDEALPLVDKDLLQAFEKRFHIKVTADRIKFKDYYSTAAVTIKGYDYDTFYTSSSDDPEMPITVENVVSLINDALKININSKRFKNCNIDVFSSKILRRGQLGGAYAILKGDSGTLYYTSLQSPEDLYVSLAGFNKEREKNISSFDEIPESFKVIYTEVVDPGESHNYTYKDHTATMHYSWDSSEAALIKKYIPEIGTQYHTWSEDKVTAVDKGDGYSYSLMDNIDTWARSEYRSYATD